MYLSGEGKLYTAAETWSIIFLARDMEEAKLTKLEQQLWSASDNYKISILNNLSSYCRTKFPEKALDYAVKAKDLSEKFGDEKNNIDALNHIAFINATATNDIRSSRENAKQALIKAKKAQYKKGTADAHLSLAIVYTKTGDHLKALKCLLKSLDRYSELDDRIGIARTYNRLGISYQSMGNLEKSIEYFTKSKEFYEDIGDVNSIADELNNIALIYGKKGEYIRALETFGSAKILYERSGNSTANVTLNTAEIYESMGEYDKAEDLLKEALEIAEENRDRYRIAAINLHRSLLRQRTGSTLPVLSGLETALTLAIRLENKVLEKEIYQAFSQYYEGKDEYKKTLHYYKKSTQMELREKESIIQSIMAIKSNPVSDENELYRVRNNELIQINRKLKQSNEKIRCRAEKYRSMARIDFLTDLYNRRHLDTVLEREWQRSLRYGHPLSVAIIDVDYFKRVNDNFNHQIGDVVLKSISCLLQQKIRASDIIGRYGGEEFLIIFTDTVITGAAKACEKMRKSVEQYNWEEISPELKITISAGISSRGPETETPEDLVLKADQNMYKAKDKGRNRVIQ
ncbi:MAG: diguanylate cyclase [Spirochaetia bacterium]